MWIFSALLSIPPIPLVRFAFSALAFCLSGFFLLRKWVRLAISWPCPNAIFQALRVPHAEAERGRLSTASTRSSQTRRAKPPGSSSSPSPSCISSSPSCSGRTSSMSAGQSRGQEYRATGPGPCRLPTLGSRWAHSRGAICGTDGRACRDTALYIRQKSRDRNRYRLLSCFLGHARRPQWHQVHMGYTETS